MKSARVWAPFWIGLAFVVIGTMFYIKVLHGKNLLKGVLFYGVPTGIVIFALSYLLIRVHFKPSDPYVGVESIFRKVQVVTSAYVALAHGSNDVVNAVGPIAAAYAVLTMGLSGVKMREKNERIRWLSSSRSSGSRACALSSP